MLLLAIAAVTSLVLGLGLTTTACYIFLAVLVGPALEKVGLNEMAVHMFIFYWGMLSSITPPVAIASFAAAGIAGAPAMKTGWESMRVGSIIYFIPFFFVLNPALVLQGRCPEAIYLTLTVALGILLICGGIQGYKVGVGDLRTSGARMAVARAADRRRHRPGDTGRRPAAVFAPADGTVRGRAARARAAGRRRRVAPRATTGMIAMRALSARRCGPRPRR